MPKIVVSAASITGRRRLRLADIMVSSVGLSSAKRLSISSTRTMQFLINMPERLKIPSIEGNVSGRSVTNRPIATPQRVMGTVSQITMGCLRAPNIRTVIKNISAKAIGMRSPSDSLAILSFSNSPPHSLV